MAEAVAFASGIAGLLSLAIQITTLSHRYISGFKGASKAVQSLFRELSALEKVFKQLHAIANNPEFSKFEAHLQALLGVAECHDELEQIRQKLLKRQPEEREEPRKRGADGGQESQKRQVGGAITALRNRLTWPFAEEETQRRVEVLHRHQVTFTSALGIVSFNMTMDTSKTVVDTSKDVKSLCASEMESTQRKILKWLSSVDYISNQSAARLKHEPETGNWLLESESFKNWLKGQKQFLWIYGIPGSGKTVLCSTAIDHIQRSQVTHQSTDQNIEQNIEQGPDLHGLAYFYFDFKDRDKQVLGRFLRSIVAQLSRQLSSFPAILLDLHKQYEAETAHLPDTELTKVLTSILSQFKSSTIVIDALDECREQGEVMEKLALLIKDSSINTRILITSRKERDIELGLEGLTTDRVPLQGGGVEHDISLHVCNCLERDKTLSRRPDDVKKKIESALIDGARGMFRWVACQLDALRSCKTLSSLEVALKSLPKTLDETYDRALTSIEPENQLIARTALEWLCFSCRPLELSELAEVVALKSRSYPLEFPEHLFEPEDLFSICPSLISSSPVKKTPYYLLDEREVTLVQLAHYSVQEYLVSERIRIGPAKAFALDEGTSKPAMAEKCLSYLLGFRNPGSLYHGVCVDYPYLEYAAEYSVNHTESALEHPGSLDSGLNDLIREYSNHSKHDAFLNSKRITRSSRDSIIQFYTWKDTSEAILFTHTRNSLGTPLSDAAENGAILLCKFLLENGADANEICGKDNDERPLTLAAWRGHIDIVRLFLNANVTLDVEGTEIPLAEAARGGHNAIVELLVEAGACINLPGGTPLRNPLSGAAAWGNPTTVETLLRLGADIHWKSCNGEILLHIAARAHHFHCKELSQEECARKLLQIFLDGGLDINADSDYLGTPLTAAIDRQNEIEVGILLERGADAGMKTGDFGKPLEAARRKYHSRKGGGTWHVEEARRIKILLKNHLKAKGEEVEDSDSDYEEPGKWWEEVEESDDEESDDEESDGGESGGEESAGNESEVDTSSLRKIDSEREELAARQIDTS